MKLDDESLQAPLVAWTDFPIAISLPKPLKIGAGDTLFTGGDGDDALTGGDGDDILFGGLGKDTLDGGAGGDTALYTDKALAVTVALNGSTAVTVTVGGVAEDTLRNIENVTGGSGADTLTGDGLANTLVGGAGDDSLLGGGGADVLNGGAGRDTLNGGAGADKLIGGAGNDTYVTDGADTIIEAANAGTDFVRSSVTFSLGANLENLTLIGSAAINGTGNALNNVLTGNAAANVLNGATGADTLIGGLGNDTYVTDGGDTIVEAANAGTDLVRSSVTFSLGANLENLSLIGSAAINGTGNALNNVLTGNAGANTLVGGAGNDKLFGGAGWDVLNGGDGPDQADYRSATAAVTVSLANPAINTGEAAGDTFVSIEAVKGSDFADTLTGDAGQNYLSGGLGDDVLNGGDGGDGLAGGLGADVLNGGAGLDHALYGTAASGLTVSLANPAQNTGEAAGDTFVSIEGVTGSGFADTLIGDAGDNRLNGGFGADALNGGAGNDYAVYWNATAGVTVNLLNPASNTGEAAGDTFVSIENLEGSSYADILTGNAGVNFLNGLLGADTLNGGYGNDKLYGAAGADTFVFNTTLNATANVDFITDFTAIDDTVILENAVFTALTATGPLAADAFFIGAAAHDPSDRILYNSATGALLYDSDGAGAAAAIQFATAAPGLPLTSADFAVI